MDSYIQKKYEYEGLLKFIDFHFKYKYRAK